MTQNLQSHVSSSVRHEEARFEVPVGGLDNVVVVSHELKFLGVASEYFGEAASRLALDAPHKEDPSEHGDCIEWANIALDGVRIGEWQLHNDGSFIRLAAV